MSDIFQDELRAALERACQAQSDSVITRGRREILAMPRDAVGRSIEFIATNSLPLDDEWEFRRLLELYEQLDRELLQRLIDTGLTSDNADVRTAAQEFRAKV